MIEAIVITPVKDSVNTTIETIEAIINSNYAIHYIVYNDFSSQETKLALEKAKSRYNFELVHLEDITTNPSPNYKLVLQKAQERALKENLPLIIVESDVKIEKDTFATMVNFSKAHTNVGLVGAITVDVAGEVNFPYLKFKKQRSGVISTKRSLSFCCTLISNDFLKSYSFQNLDQTKHWFDVFISHKSIELNFNNYVLADTSVLHQPHASRPWKQLKYTNPLKYYFLKFIKRRDKI